MQLKLDLAEINDQIASVWERIDDEQRQVVVDRLSRLISRAVLHDPKEDSSDDD